MKTEIMMMVERIVRHVLASTETKLRMREELYSHLDAIYTEELQRTGNSKAALAAAFARFGDPQEIRTQLQQSVPKWKQWGSRYNQLVSRHSGESRVRFAARMALMTSGSLAAIYIIMLSMLYLSVQKEELLLLYSFLLQLSLLFGLNGFVAILCAQPFVEPAALREEMKGCWFQGVFVGLTTAGSIALLWGQLIYMHDMPFTILPQTLSGFLAGWGLFVLVVWFLRMEKLKSFPWESLDLND